MAPKSTPQEFISIWSSAALKERAASQSHFNDLCRLVNHDTPAEMDPTGDYFTFEKGAKKPDGSDGYSDVWKKGYFAWEYKGKHANLDKAYSQLLQYKDALGNPPLLIVSDIDTIVIHTNFTNTVRKPYVITLQDLLVPEKFTVLRDVFFNPEHLKAPVTTQQVTEQAAREFARLAERLRSWGEDPQKAAHFLIRLLFCLFAEDVGLLPNKVFTELVKRSRSNVKTFTALLGQLFTAMQTGGWFGMEQIPHVNGSLFNNAEVLELDTECMDILVRVSTLDWSSIEPTIFGTLFERSLDPGKRTQLGAHYTSKEDILLIVEPVLMLPLRRRFEEVKTKAYALDQKRKDLQAKRGSDKQKSLDKINKDLSSLVLSFSEELASYRVLDPACGSGNFLYVSLRQMLDLWKEVSLLAREVGLPMLLPTPGQAPSPAQLYGIEINEYAHELAQTTIWIGYIQWFVENGFGFPPEPILRPLDNIQQMDAILAYDEDGEPVEPEWPEAEVIIGNPPFLGDKKMRAELGDKVVEDLRKIYSGRLPGQSDLVCYWFEKSLGRIRNNTIIRVGLLATQAIRGGANRTVLDRIKVNGDIFWAYSDRDWILDGATVHVSMVGFDSGKETQRYLDGRSVSIINSNLTAGIDITIAKKLAENSSIGFIGTQKTGSFELTKEVALIFLADRRNPNGKHNSDVVKPWINAMDITNRCRDMFIIYFGTQATIDEASQYEMPFEYLKKVVKPEREKSRQKTLREKWWLFEKPRPALREALRGFKRYIATPMVSKHRLFTWINKEVISENLLVVIAREDDYFLGVLHSKIHELWARIKGTQLREAESGGRYTPTTTFETFPFPWSPGKEPLDDPRVQRIAEAARELVEKRDAWLNPPDCPESELKKRTLTNLYNQRPTWLDLAHKKLDEAVFDAYGWPHDLSDEEILERLLELNLLRAEANTE